ncbi:unnamed protein product [Closterium sp. NIES-53]
MAVQEGLVADDKDDNSETVLEDARIGLDLLLRSLARDKGPRSPPVAKSTPDNPPPVDLSEADSINATPLEPTIGSAPHNNTVTPTPKAVRFRGAKTSDGNLAANEPDSASASQPLHRDLHQQKHRPLQRKHLILYVTFIRDDSVVTEFMALLNVEKVDAASLLSLLLSHVQAVGIDLRRIAGISTDGADVMMGCKSGLVTRLRLRIPHLVTTHSIAHIEALAAKDASDDIPDFKIVDKVIRNVAEHLRRSGPWHQRFLELQEMFTSTSLELQGIHVLDCASLHAQIKRTTFHIEIRYVDCGDDFGGGISERLSPFLMQHGPRGTREMTVAGINSDGRPTGFSFVLHEDPMEEFGGCGTHDVCVDVYTALAEMIVSNIHGRLGDLESLSGLRLFTPDAWPLDRGERHAWCVEWLESLITLFKAEMNDDILPGINKRRAVKELRMFTSVLASAHKTERSFHAGLTAMLKTPNWRDNYPNLVQLWVAVAVFHTFTLDSGTSRSFFRDRTTLTPLSRPVAVSLADPSGGPVLASFSTVLPCPAAPFGTLSGLYLPSFSTNLVSGADLQDQGVDQFTPASQRVTHCTCARTGRHLATFTRRPGSSLYTLSTESPPVPPSGQVAASSQVLATSSGPGPESAPCSCRLLSHQTLLWHHRLGHPSLPRLRGMASRVLELRLLTYLLTDLGEQPRSPPVLYVDNKAMLALCREHRLEHRTKHIALRYFLARELQQRGQLRLAYMASQANTADIFTKALPPGDHQRFCTMLACFALLDWSCDLLFSPTLPMGVCQTYML